MDEKIKGMSQEMYEMNEKMKGMSQDIQHFESKMLELMEYKSKLQVLSQEIDRLNQTISQYEQELIQYRNEHYEFNAMEQKMKEQLTTFVLMFAEIESLRSRVLDK